MAVLSDADFKEVLKQRDGIVLLNRRKESITGPGYDLTIGFLRDADTGEEPSSFTDIKGQIRCTLLPGHRYLVISKEFLYVSSHYMATIHSRGSYALKGLLLSSTVVDPNYAGCIAGCLFNSTPKPIHIKKDNQFATMVFHEFRTPTNTTIGLNDCGMPMDTLETLHGAYSNIHPDVCRDGDLYCGTVWEKVKYTYNDALKKMHTNSGTCATGTTEQNYQRKNVQVTFLIGNGFDLNVGLKTRYSDFYPFYTGQCPEELLAGEIAGALERWSDLEAALGKCTKRISPEQLELFRHSEINLEDKLKEYLERELRRADYENNQKAIEKEMIFFLEEPFRRRYEDSPAGRGGDVLKAPKTYKFVNFNYTNVLDRCLEIVLKRYHSLPILREGGKMSLHIHGAIETNDIVLGVNDAWQVANECLRTYAERFSLIKEDINRLIYHNNKTQELQSILEQSDIICVYGMSFGETDKRWWQTITNLLREDSARTLILFSRQMDEHQGRKGQEFIRPRVLDQFFAHVDNSEDVRKCIDRQICVQGTKELFQFRLVKEPE